jgi:hypothetical protein
MNEREIESDQPRIKVPHSAIVRGPGLLPMYYSTRELSDELGVPRKTIILWVRNGLPHTRDNQNHIWVIGSECTAWIETMRKANLNKIPLSDGEAFCFRCRKPVEIQDPQTKAVSGRLLLSGKCPICDCRVNKGVRDDKPE